MNKNKQIKTQIHDMEKALEWIHNMKKEGKLKQKGNKMNTFINETRANKIANEINEKISNLKCGHTYKDDHCFDVETIKEQYK